MTDETKPEEDVKPKLDRLNITEQDLDPLKFLERVMNDKDAPATLRVRAALALVQEKKKVPGGSNGGYEPKKVKAKKAAEEASRQGNKFAPSEPPKLN